MLGKRPATTALVHSTVEDQSTQKVVDRPIRMEERGKLQKITPQSFCLLFEFAPVWLLALTPLNTDCIYLLNCNSFAAFHSHLHEHKIDKILYQSVISALGKRCFIFSTPPDDIVYLVSGSLPYLNDKSVKILNKRSIFVTDHNVRFRRKIPSSYLTCSRITHAMVGGATTFEGIYAYNPGVYSPTFSTLRRKLGDFLDYSLPPVVLSTSLPSTTYTGLLNLTRLFDLIHYPTHFSTCGYGYRHLTIEKLSQFFWFNNLTTVQSQYFSNISLSTSFNIGHLIGPSFGHK